MASYFDEHDCTPLAEGERPDALLAMARFLATSGYWSQVSSFTKWLLLLINNIYY